VTLRRSHDTPNASGFWNIPIAQKKSAKIIDAIQSCSWSVLEAGSVKLAVDENQIEES